MTIAKLKKLQLTHLTIWLLAALLCGCKPSEAGAENGASTPAPSAPARVPIGNQHALTIYGFNYTDRYIDQFSVDGTGGSNLDVSTPTDGGGKGTCCVAWRDGTPLPTKVHVRWAADACEFTTKPNSDGETFDAVHHIFREVDVELKGPVPKSPGYFEVHFYPDGHIEVAITEQWSSPRLSLPENREKPMRRCSAEDWKGKQK